MSSIAAVDIGSTKVVAAIVDLENGGSPRLIGVGIAPCSGTKKGVVVDIEDTAEAIVGAIRKAEHMANRKIGAAAVSISGEHLRSRESRGLVPILNPARTISREDVHRVINHSKQIAIENDREMIMAIPRSFRVDGQDGVTRPLDMSGERLEVDTLLVTGLSSHIDNLQKSMSKAQLEVENVVPRAIATGLAVTDASERDSGVAVIDIGGGATDIVVYNEGSPVHIAMLPIGAQHVTSDIQYLLKTSPEEAERIKIDSGSCDFEQIGEDEFVEVEQLGASQRRPFSRKVLAEIIASRMREILCMARDEIAAATGFRKIGAGIVLTGGGSAISGLADLAAGVFETGVRTGSPQHFGGLGDSLGGPEHATAAGLIRHGLRAREDGSVAAESGDWRKFIRNIGSIFSNKPKEEAK
jgi:cell division protein FtsA